MAKIETKICGLRDDDSLAAALAGGADYVGFNFYPPSPRSLDPRAARPLAAAAAHKARRVGLFVDPTDIVLTTTLAEVELDLIQLHGAESPERVRQVRDRFGRPVIKAVPIASAMDLAAALAWRDVADVLLFDAKPPARPDALPGGNALAFDWRLLADAPPAGSWMLSGGLTPGNVGEAVQTARAAAVDVASGVERSRGVKDPDLILAFLAAVRDAA